MLLGVSCTPLLELELYSAGEPETSVSAAGGAVWGGQGGQGEGGEAPIEPLCGNGEIELGEECDDAGMSLTCADDCTKLTCPEDCECQIFEGSYLVLCTERIRHVGAKQACNNAGLGFDIPVSRREQEFLQAWSSRLGIGLLWLGGSDAAEEGVWRTGSGIVFWRGPILGDPVPGVYVNWRPSQPDNFAEAQHCMSQGTTGGWDDENCGQLRAYFCSRRPQENAGCGDGALVPGEVCDEAGLATETCDRDCTLAVCGDGVTNLQAGEECDDGNTDDLDACRNDCTKPALIAYFPLSETIGNRAWDLGSMEHHGDLQAGAAFSDTGEGVTLDGVAQYILIPESRAPVLPGEITMMAMVKAVLPLPTTPVHQAIITNADADEETWLRLRGESLQGGAWWGTALNAAEHSMVDLWKDEAAFHHVAARYDGKAWALFHDGELLVETVGAVGALPATGPLTLGGRPDGRYLAGSLRELRIYGEALSGEEIAVLAQRGLSGP